MHSAKVKHDWPTITHAYKQSHKENDTENWHGSAYIPSPKRKRLLSGWVHRLLEYIEYMYI